MKTMNEIKPIEQTLSSLEVAEMVGKQHNKLLVDIRRYIKQGTEQEIDFGDFFTESTYKDSHNQDRPCYQITKKGCEFIAHKLTGAKGTAFTAQYINRFHQMEEQLAGQIPAEVLNRICSLLEQQSQRIRKLEDEKARCPTVRELPMPEDPYESDIQDDVRLKQLSELADQVSLLYHIDKMLNLHKLYTAMKNIGLPLDAYRAVYQYEYDPSCSMLAAIAHFDSTYNTAVMMLESAIHKKQS